MGFNVAQEPLSAIVAVLAFAISLALTGWFRSYALKVGLLDVPNERSSHSTDTPRGGGVAIVLTTLTILPLLGALHIADWKLVQGCVAAGTLAAGIGYADDRMSVPMLFRLFFQFAAAAMVLMFIGFDAVLEAVPVLDAVPWVAAILTLFYLVWMLNLTNFMDGIDGIASVEVITVCVGAVLCVLAAPHLPASFFTEATAAGESMLRRNGTIAFALTLAAATAGFLKWNWPPARIFMGDAGSGFVGILLGALTLAAGTIWPTLVWSCVILAGVFVVDATTTLIRRIAQHEQFYQAHRSHAYQHASRKYGHARVTVAVLLINGCWLLPWAWLAASGRVYGAVALVLAYIPLLPTAIRFRAGLRD